MRNEWRPTCLTMIGLMVFMAAAPARAQDQIQKPPINSGQGPSLHGTGKLEHVNIPLKLVPPCMPPCVEPTFVNGVLTFWTGAPDPAGKKFSAPFAGGTIYFKIERSRRHQNVLLMPRHDDVRPETARQARLDDQLGHEGIRVGDPTPAAIAPANLRQYAHRLQEYQVKWGMTEGETTIDLCSPGDSSGWALAVPGAWSTGGVLLPPPPGESQAQHFTFACVPRRDSSGVTGGGSIAKCVDWGYPPWGTSAAIAPVLREQTSRIRYGANEAQRYHQVCVRMAQADYCGEGGANTLDGTRIGFADITNVFNLMELSLSPGRPPQLHLRTGPVQSTSSGPRRIEESLNPVQRIDLDSRGARRESSIPALYLEAIWGIDRCGRARALCLAKKRWNTLSVAGTCVDQSVANSIANRSICFVNPNGTIDRARCSRQEPSPICDYWSEDELRGSAASGLLFSYSTFVDKALVSFKGPSDGWLTTTKIEGGPTVLAEGYDAQIFSVSRELSTDAESYREVRYEGPIFKGQVRTDLKPLYQCHHRVSGVGTRYLLTDQVGCGEPEFVRSSGEAEGYLYAPDESVAGTESRRGNALILWRKGSSYATSTQQPDGYQRYRVLGYLPRVSQLAE